KALITIEPSGAPDPAKADAAGLKGVPHLIVWGDFIDRVSVWSKLMINPTKWSQAIQAAGGKVDTFELPKMGIKGNTHMMMMDRIADDSAKLVTDWSEKQGLGNGAQPALEQKIMRGGRPRPFPFVFHPDRPD